MPWRDSAFTMLIKEPLSGNFRTAYILTINEDPEMLGETVSALRFRISCGALENQTHAAEVVDSDMEVAVLK